MRKVHKVKNNLVFSKVDDFLDNYTLEEVVDIFLACKISLRLRNVKMVRLNHATNKASKQFMQAYTKGVNDNAERNASKD